MDAKSHYARQAILCVARIAEDSGLDPVEHATTSARFILDMNSGAAKAYVEDLLKYWGLVYLDLIQYVPRDDNALLHTTEHWETVTEDFLEKREPCWQKTFEEALVELRERNRE
jgi:hypothetical protein